MEDASFKEFVLIMLGWAGIYAPLGLGALGSMIGCSIAGQAGIGAMLDVESGGAKLVVLSGMPFSQTLYGFLVMQALTRPVTFENAPALFAVGILSGIALLVSAWRQGDCLASAVNVAKVKPEAYGISITPAAMVEGAAIFAFVFAMILAGTIPTAESVSEKVAKSNDAQSVRVERPLEKSSEVTAGKTAAE